MKTSLPPLSLLFLILLLGLNACHARGEADPASSYEMKVPLLNDQIDLPTARPDSLNNEEQAEWAIFKADNEFLIDSNFVRIDRLKNAQRIATGEKGAAFAEWILELENRNFELKTRLTNYDTNTGSWKEFKAEFERDMYGMNKALENFAQMVKRK
ncbi:MAG: hypothetical protein J0M30_00345 [Chitinophagales bacterium]|nr:hypothetical protein [Chitinophagales bacterium]